MVFINSKWHFTNVFTPCPPVRINTCPQQREFNVTVQLKVMASLLCFRCCRQRLSWCPDSLGSEIRSFHCSCPCWSSNATPHRNPYHVLTSIRSHTQNLQYRASRKAWAHSPPRGWFLPGDVSVWKHAHVVARSNRLPSTRPRLGALSSEYSILLFQV